MTLVIQPLISWWSEINPALIVVDRVWSWSQQSVSQQVTWLQSLIILLFSQSLIKPSATNQQITTREILIFIYRLSHQVSHLSSSLALLPGLQYRCNAGSSLIRKNSPAVNRGMCVSTEGSPIRGNLQRNQSPNVNIWIINQHLRNENIIILWFYFWSFLIMTSEAV